MTVFPDINAIQLISKTK